VRKQVVVNIDDDEMARRGVSSILTETFPDLEIRERTFAAALNETDWSNIDFVVIDLSQPCPDDKYADEFPGIRAAQHVFAHAPGQGPYVFVITGDYGAYHEPLVGRRLFEAGVSSFYYRTDFWKQIQRIFDHPQTPMDSPQTIDSRTDLPELGIERRSRLNELVEALVQEQVVYRKMTGGLSNSTRKTWMAIGRIKAVDKKGQQTDSLPPFSQYQSIFERAARLSRNRRGRQ
jgi:DNA-binding NarL/FixJ family response regulator